MQAFEYIGYPRQKIIIDIDVEDFLTSDYSSGIYVVAHGSWIKRLSAVNYGTFGPNEPTRGIQDGADVWFMDIKAKTLTRKRSRNVLYDADKVRERIIFEGSAEQILDELERKGYRRESSSL